eukprot:93810_1
MSVEKKLITETMMTTSPSSYLKLAVNGFVRREEKINAPFYATDDIMGIYAVDSIMAIIVKYCKYYRIECIINDMHIDKKKFKLSQHNTTLQAVEKITPCNHHFMYFEALSEIDNQNGFSVGVHHLSIKMKMDNAACMHTIGVISTKNNATNDWPKKASRSQGRKNYLKALNLRLKTKTKKKRKYSYIDNFAWKKNDVITIVLDCAKYTVEYYVNYNGPVKTEYIQKK